MWTGLPHLGWFGWYSIVFWRKNVEGNEFLKISERLTKNSEFRFIAAERGFKYASDEEEDNLMYWNIEHENTQHK